MAKEVNSVEFTLLSNKMKKNVKKIRENEIWNMLEEAMVYI